MKTRPVVAFVVLLMVSSVLMTGCTYRIQTTSPSSSSAQSPTAAAGGVGTTYMLAVRQVGFNQYEGVVTEIIVQMEPGTGQVFVNTAPLTGYDFQETARTAIDVAASRAHIDPNQYDFRLTIRGPTNMQVVDGPSAGLPMTVAAYSAMVNTPARSTVYSTGEIFPSGAVGPVGAVYAKALAAAQNGATVILLPDSETTTRITTSDGAGTSTRTISVQDELNKQYAVTVVGVKTFDDALPYYFG